VSPDLTLRLPRADEEEELLRAHRASSSQDVNFLRYYGEGMPIGRYLELLREQDRGVNVPLGHVPTTILFAFVGPRIVGRLSIRHWLNPSLERMGGHIGYVVVPEFRRRGYATEILRQALRIARDRHGLRFALVTCDDDNVGSRRTIEKCGGVLRDVVPVSITGKAPKRRYWIYVPPEEEADEPGGEVCVEERWGRGSCGRGGETCQPSGSSGGSAGVAADSRDIAVGRFVAELTEWVARRRDISAAALVGSCARGAGRPDSEIDLVILTPNPTKYAQEIGWTTDLGQVSRVAVESYGRATSVRAWYLGGLEVEYILAPEDRAALPPGEGASGVVSEGVQVLFERSPALRKLLLEAGMMV
jgi:predicted acetyltransferase/predicted nucleotidyltransferase